MVKQLNHVIDSVETLHALNEIYRLVCARNRDKTYLRLVFSLRSRNRVAISTEISKQIFSDFYMSMLTENRQYFSSSKALNKFLCACILFISINFSFNPFFTWWGQNFFFKNQHFFLYTMKDYYIYNHIPSYITDIYCPQDRKYLKS